MLKQRLAYCRLLRQSLVHGLVLFLYLLWVPSWIMNLRIALGLRLGVTIVVEHTCICGAVVNVYGSHSLSCKRSGGHIPQHAAVNETVRHALVSVGVATCCFGACGCMS